jgi:hypothetical protein
LSISEELHEVTAISWLYMVALQMKRDVPECHGIAVDIQRPYGVRIIAAIFRLFQLALKKLGKV